MKRNKKPVRMIVTNTTDPNLPYLLAIIGLYDRKGEQFIETSFVQNTGVAIRGFTAAINNNNPDNNLWKWPEDYELYTLGLYDNRRGELHPKPKQLLATGEQVKIR